MVWRDQDASLLKLPHKTFPISLLPQVNPYICVILLQNITSSFIKTGGRTILIKKWIKSTSSHSLLQIAVLLNNLKTTPDVTQCSQMFWCVMVRTVSDDIFVKCECCFFFEAKHIWSVHNYCNWVSEGILIILSYYNLCNVSVLVKPLHPNKASILLFALSCQLFIFVQFYELCGHELCEVDIIYLDAYIIIHCLGWDPILPINSCVCWIMNGSVTQDGATCPYLQDWLQPTTPFYSRCCHYKIMDTT